MGEILKLHNPRENIKTAQTLGEILKLKNPCEIDKLHDPVGKRKLYVPGRNIKTA